MELQRFSAELQSLPAMLAFVKASLLQHRSDVEVAAEEALVNVIKHGYEGKGGWIAISCICHNDSIVLSIRDEGVPFDWVREIARSGHQGYGLKLLAHYTSSVSYERVSGENHFSMYFQDKHDRK